MKLDLYLMTFKGYKVLKAIIDNGFYDIVNVVIVGEDKNVNNDYSKEIVKLCIENNLKFFQRGSEFYSDSNYALAISWRWLIDKKSSKLIVLHDSILPKYRGFAPLVNSLINGEKFIGVTALFANEDFDRGNIIFQEQLEVKYPIKIKNAIEIISKLYENLALKIISKLKNEQFLDSQIQNEKMATYSLWRDKDDYFIDWNNDATYIKRFIDSLSFPYKGASTILNGEILRIQDAEVCNDVKIENRDVGKVLFVENGYPIVVCRVGLLKITTIVTETGSSFLPLKKVRLKFKNN